MMRIVVSPILVHFFLELHQPSASLQKRCDRLLHEVRARYLYGKEVEIIIKQGTVIGIVSANRISQPSQEKLNEAGIAFAENIPKSAFNNS